MSRRPSTAAHRVDVSAEQTTDDPVLHAVLTAPVRPGQPPAWEAEALEEAAEGPWFDGASVSAEIAARARREQ
jgi:hypothetical protein